MNASSESVLNCLHDEQLSAVTFVQDYLQLHFDGPCLNSYVWPIVKSKGITFQFKQPGYRDALCGLIAKKVSKTSAVLGQILQVEFVDGSLIEFSLKEEDREGPEAVMLQDADRKKWNVW